MQCTFISPDNPFIMECREGIDSRCASPKIVFFYKSTLYINMTVRYSLFKLRQDRNVSQTHS